MTCQHVISSPHIVGVAVVNYICGGLATWYCEEKRQALCHAHSHTDKDCCQPIKDDHRAV